MPILSPILFSTCRIWSLLRIEIRYPRDRTPRWSQGSSSSWTVRLGSAPCWISSKLFPSWDEILEVAPPELGELELLPFFFLGFWWVSWTGVILLDSFQYFFHLLLSLELFFPGGFLRIFAGKLGACARQPGAPRGICSFFSVLLLVDTRFCPVAPAGLSNFLPTVYGRAETVDSKSQVIAPIKISSHDGEGYLIPYPKESPSLSYKGKRKGAEKGKGTDRAGKSSAELSKVTPPQNW